MREAEDPIAKLAAAPGFKLTCPSCGHEDSVPQDPSERVYTCDQCGCSIACGLQMPRIFILPNADRRFVVLRLASGKPKDSRYEVDISVPLEKRYATGFALDLLSTADAGLFQDFLAFLAAKKIVDDAPSPPADEAVMSLDAPRH